jgi:hypothetical protein
MEEHLSDCRPNLDGMAMKVAVSDAFFGVGIPRAKSEKAKSKLLAFGRLRNLLKLVAFAAFDFRSEIVGNLLHLSVEVASVHRFNNAIDDSGNVRYAGNGNRLLSRLELKLGMAVANKAVE